MPRAPDAPARGWRGRIRGARLRERLHAVGDRLGLAPEQTSFGALVLGFLFLIGLAVTGMGRAVPVVEWMNIFSIRDFTSLGDAVNWVRDLRVPIPPNLALLEIAEYQLFGSVDVTNGVLYHAYVVISYACVLLLCYPSKRQLAASGTLAVLFAYCTKLIAPGNPLVYDVAAPCFFLLFALLLRLGSTTSRPRLAAAALIGAGFFLSMFEMARPFVVFLLPVIVLGACLVIASRRRILLFLVPVVLLSGTWHAHLLVAHRQVTASNHFGVNLWRCWHTRVPPLAKPLAEDDAPLAPGRWANLNNPQHLKNSLRLRKKIVKYIVEHPLDSAGFMAQRVWKLTAGETAIYSHKPSHALLGIYSPAVRVTSLVFIAGFALLCGRFVWLLVRRRDRMRETFASVGNIIVFVGCSSMFILAVAEVEEEARFVISLLPILATLAPLQRWLFGGPGRNPAANE